MPKPEIRKVNGIPRLFLDGRETPTIVYRNRQNDYFEYMKQFADSGVELFFMTYLRDWRVKWDEHFREVERRLRGILEFNDRVVCVLGLYLSTTREWAEEHPEELCWWRGHKSGLIGEGGYLELEYLTAGYSLTSYLFDEAAREQIERNVEFLEKFDLRERVVGMFLEAGAAQEWNHFMGGDDGPSAVRAFRDYLRRKYESVGALREAWNDSRAEFETARAPSPEELLNPPRGDYFPPRSRGQRMADWNLAVTDAVGERMVRAAEAVKKHRPGLLVGFFHEPLFVAPRHYPVRKVLESPHADFCCGPPQYSARFPGQHMPLQHMVDSVHACGKLFFSEEDIRTYDVPARRGRRCGIQGDATCIEDTLACYEKGFGQAIAKGTMAWYWHFQSEWFDERKEYFQMNRLMTDISLLVRKKGSRQVSEVLVVVDETSPAHMRSNNRVNKNQIERTLTFEMGHIGAPVDVVMPSTILDEGFERERYRLVFFLNLHVAGEEERRAADSLKRDGRTLVFTHGAGFLDERAASVENMRRLTSFEFEELDLCEAPVIIVPDTPTVVSEHLSTGFTFGQCYRGLRMIPDGKGKPLFPPVTRVSPIFAVSDPDAVDLGFYSVETEAAFAPRESTPGAVRYGFPGDTEYYVGMAMKENDGWRAVYAGATLLPSVLLRALAKLAGVHVYLDTDDIVYANEHILVVHTNEEKGERALRFPRPTNVYDLKANGKELAHEASELVLGSEPRRTHLLWLDSSPPKLEAARAR